MKKQVVLWKKEKHWALGVESDPFPAAATFTCPVVATKGFVYSQREINDQLLPWRLQDNIHTSCLRGSSHFQ